MFKIAPALPVLLWTCFWCTKVAQDRYYRCTVFSKFVKLEINKSGKFCKTGSTEKLFFFSSIDAATGRPLLILNQGKWKRCDYDFLFNTPEGRPGMSDISHYLESQACHLIPLCYLLSSSSACSCCSFRLFFLPTGPFCWLYPQKIVPYFSLWDRLFDMTLV